MDVKHDLTVKTSWVRRVSNHRHVSFSVHQQGTVQYKLSLKSFMMSLKELTLQPQYDLISKHQLFIFLTFDQSDCNTVLTLNASLHWPALMCVTVKHSIFLLFHIEVALMFISKCCNEGVNHFDQKNLSLEGFCLFVLSFLLMYFSKMTDVSFVYFQ